MGTNAAKLLASPLPHLPHTLNNTAHYTLHSTNGLYDIFYRNREDSSIIFSLFYFGEV
jgi:hypothetical protein